MQISLDNIFEIEKCARDRFGCKSCQEGSFQHFGVSGQTDKVATLAEAARLILRRIARSESKYLTCADQREESSCSFFKLSIAGLMAKSNKNMHFVFSFLIWVTPT